MKQSTVTIYPSLDPAWPGYCVVTDDKQTKWFKTLQAAQNYAASLSNPQPATLAISPL